MRGNVELRTLVYGLRRGRQHIEAVGEAWRDPQLKLVLGREHAADPFAERARRPPQVDGDIEHRPFDHSDQLPLRAHDLIMKATQYALTGLTMVVLDETQG